VFRSSSIAALGFRVLAVLRLSILALPPFLKVKRDF
jgi:hypothetical protein